MIKGIEHIGIAVENLKEAQRYYEDVLGLECYRTEVVEEQKVTTAFYRVGDTKIELLESTSEDGPIAKFIAKRGPGIHHLAFAVDGIEESLETVAGKDIQLIDQKPRKGAEGLDIAFLHPKSTFGVLTEFCEKKNA